MISTIKKYINENPVSPKWSAARLERRLRHRGPHALARRSLMFTRCYFLFAHQALSTRRYSNLLGFQRTFLHNVPLFSLIKNGPLPVKLFRVPPLKLFVERWLPFQTVDASRVIDTGDRVTVLPNLISRHKVSWRSFLVNFAGGNRILACCHLAWFNRNNSARKGRAGRQFREVEIERIRGEAFVFCWGKWRFM